jgi:CubicO group peptidase (beta-lactamase class C family)
MKKNILQTAILSVVTGAAVILSGCSKNNMLEQSARDSRSANSIGDLATVAFSVDKFAQNIENYMNGKVSGYGYTIFHEGAIYYRGDGGGGWARRPVDAPAVEHGAQQRQDIASSTKFITALATIALLDKYHMSLSEPVYKYLPSNWVPSETFKELTFERLLAHRTGLIKYGGEWNELKATVEGPMNLIEFYNNTRTYNNVNFALMAVILPYVAAKKEFINDYNYLKLIENNTEMIYDAIGARYTGIARTYVFKPAGLTYWSSVSFRPWNNYGPIDPETASKGYATANGSEKGTTNGIHSRNGGAGGLYISTAEFGKVQTAAANGKIVSATRYQYMKDKLLGLDGVVNGARGKYYWKNGGANNRETMIFDFGKTQVAVFANSSTSEIGNKPSILVNAYETAWTAN